MGSATRTTEIAAPATEVWAILTELDAYHDWESGYVMSEYTSDQRTGVGVTRRVELKSPMGVRWANHEITRWEEPSVIAWAARSSNFPLLARAEQVVTLRAAGNTTHVQNTVTYTLKYGWLGRIIDPIMFRPIVKGGVEGFVDSLAARAQQNI